MISYFFLSDLNENNRDRAIPFDIFAQPFGVRGKNAVICFLKNKSGYSRDIQSPGTKRKTEIPGPGYLARPRAFIGAALLHLVSNIKHVVFVQ